MIRSMLFLIALCMLQWLTVNMPKKQAVTLNEPIRLLFRERQRQILVIEMMFIALLPQLFVVREYQRTGSQDTAVVFVTDSLVQRGLKTGSSAGVVALVCRLAVPGRAFNLTKVFVHATRRRQAGKSVETKQFFGPFQKSKLRCALRISFSTAVFTIDDQLLVQ